MARTASIERRTGETQVSIDINLDGQGAVRIETGVGFLDHMLHLMARHGCFDLKAVAKGDLHIDSHHTVEDVGLTLGQALNEPACHCAPRQQHPPSVGSPFQGYGSRVAHGL